MDHLVCAGFFIAVIVHAVFGMPPSPLDTTEHGKYSVFRMVPANQSQLEFLGSLWLESSESNLDFWKPPKAVGTFVDVMVPPSMLKEFPKILTEQGISFVITIDDVQQLIEREKHPMKGIGKVLRDDVGGARYDFSTYGDYESMRSFMDALSQQYSHIVRRITIGYSHNRIPIEGLQIGKPMSGVTKRSIWVDGGVHAREWAASHVALYFIKLLVTRYERDPEITHLVDNLDWFIVPLINPDGYEYSRSATHPEVRLWRKNRSPEQCISIARPRRAPKTKCCKGVDLNRNFDFHWGETGSSENPCEGTYQGTNRFSEPEARAVRDFVGPRTHQIDAFITLHTYSQIWIHSFGHQRNSYPADYEQLVRVGRKAAYALKKLYGTRYIVGSGADTLYPASGGSDDWAKQSGIKFVYLLELRPDEAQYNGFILDEHELLPTARETWEGVKVVANEVMIFRGIRPWNDQRAADPTEACFDKRLACKRWVENNPSLCRTVRYFMRDQCAFSCQLCSV